MKASNSSPSINPAMKTIAIMQLTRFGDLIQTLQAIDNLKQLYPQYRVILIARSQFAQPLNFLIKSKVDKLYLLDTQKIFSNKDLTGIKGAVSELDTFLNSVNSEDIEVLVNLSFSKSSNYLATLINSNHHIGSHFNKTHNTIVSDKWSQLLYSTVMRGNLNPFSLVDLFRNIIGLKPSPSNVSLVKSQKRKSILIHPFASSERKSWKVEKWVEIIYRLLKDHPDYSITLAGAKNEVLKSQLICENPLLKTFQSRITNLTGKTNLEELFKELSVNQFFVGHDSMVGHLASLTQTPTLTISLGSVRPHETTPYHVNAYNLAPKTKCFPCFPSDNCQYYQCQHDIPYQAVTGAVKCLIENGEINSENIKQQTSSFHLSSVNLYKAKYENGVFGLTNLCETHLDHQEIFRTFYKITWSFVLGDQEINSTFPKLNPKTHKELLMSLNGIQHLYELSEFGMKYSQYILEEIASQNPSIQKIKEFSKKIDEIDQLQRLVEKTHPYLAPIIDYFTLRKGNLFGENVVQLTESSYKVFEECSNICSIIFELVESTISEHKNNNTIKPLNK